MSLLGLAASAFTSAVANVRNQATAETNAASYGMPAAMPMPEAPGSAYYLDGSGQYRMSVEGNKNMATLWPTVRVAARLSDWYPQGGGGDARKVPGGSQYVTPADWDMLNGRWGVIRQAANWSDLGWHLVQPAAAPPPPPPAPPPLVAQEQPITKFIPETPVVAAPEVSGPVSTGIDWSYLFKNDAPQAAPPSYVQYAQGDTYGPAQTSAVAPAAGGMDVSKILTYAAIGVGVLYALKDMGGHARGGSRRKRARR